MPAGERSSTRAAPVPAGALCCAAGALCMLHCRASGCTSADLQNRLMAAEQLTSPPPSCRLGAGGQQQPLLSTLAWQASCGIRGACYGGRCHKTDGGLRRVAACAGKLTLVATSLPDPELHDCCSAATEPSTAAVRREAVLASNVGLYNEALCKLKSV